MSELKIGKIIVACRKEKGVTQEELANHLRVSKPAVSKWESGQSYPDILLLPMIASYFNISVDKLIGYEPQMSKEDVRKLYHRLAENFAKDTFEEVYSECEEYIRNYFSCWQLQFQMGLLLLNHCNLAESPERTQELISRAKELFRRVEEASDEVNLAKQAVQMQALCYICLQSPVEAIDMLENINEPFMQTETLLVKAYQMKGDKAKAIEYLQGYTYVNLVTMLGAAPDFFMMYADQPEKLELYYNLFQKMCDIFEVEQLQPSTLFQLHLVAAQVYVMQDNKTAAVDALERYMELYYRFEHEKFNLHGNRIFDVLENYMKTLDVETIAPRSEVNIWKDLRNIILSNPAFSTLETEERFKRIKRRLEAASQKVD